MYDNVHHLSSESDAIVTMHDKERVFNYIMILRRFTGCDNFETYLKEVHKAIEIL